MSVLGYQSYVSDSIKSILDQTYSDFDLIIIDDGCDYDLKQVIDDFNDVRLKYIKNDRNLGLTFSLLKGISISKAKYIVRQDAGNISLPDRIKLQFEYLESNPEIYLTGTSVIIIDEKGEEICRETALENEEILGKTMLEYNCMYHSSIMFRNDGRYSYREKFKFSQDYDLYLRLLSDNVRFVNLPDFLIKERLTENSITYKKRQHQDYYRRLAHIFYERRASHLHEGYIDISQMQPYSSQTVQGNNISDSNAYGDFYRQKAYLLLYAFKDQQLRNTIKEYRKKYGFDLKLLVYFIMSYLPFIVKIIKRKKDIRII